MSRNHIKEAGQGQTTQNFTCIDKEGSLHRVDKKWRTCKTKHHVEQINSWSVFQKHRVTSVVIFWHVQNEQWHVPCFEHPLALNSRVLSSRHMRYHGARIVVPLQCFFYTSPPVLDVLKNVRETARSILSFPVGDNKVNRTVVKCLVNPQNTHLRFMNNFRIQ